MFKKLLISAITLTAAAANLTAQEVVAGLTGNIYLSDAKSLKQTKGIAADTLELPFFDDFSSGHSYPDPLKWLDDYVFINNTYSISQITKGVATFDALDNAGRLYETASSFVSEADRLTSVPVNLQYQPEDNIYLSFYYEAGGIGDMPEAGDSLTLEYWAPVEQKWYSAWKAPYTQETGFRAVILRIDQTRFLKKGFMFRFKNHVSLNSASADPSMAGNCDHWNIDYVMLGKNRNLADTLPPDVALTLPVRSSLKTFEEMPWKQFRQVFLSEMGPWITIHYRNNDQITRNVTRSFEITDVYNNTVVHSFTAGATNIDPSASVSYQAALIYTFNSTSTDSALFRIKSFLTTDAFDRKENDTIIYYQRFGRDFAFDDGTSEAGYGINGLGSRNAMVAYRFKSPVPDTIRAVKICFNDSYQNANRRSFDLMIWKNNQGTPGEVIYFQEEMLVEPGEAINGFHLYRLDRPFEISGDYFIGWRQRSETFLNAGFDLNTPHNGKQLYWINGDWNVSQTTGSVMIRPVFGPEINPLGIETNRSGPAKLRIWPNPAGDFITLDAGDLIPLRLSEITITGIGGKVLIRRSFQETLDISELPAGIYFITARNGNRILATGKFIVAR
ncbi:MAG: T9SS type A sorting domain-containing protein [Bacteroidales bacterium]|nr:T9SS type A sorting domain-containing protein [Bacteroidales bacterium]